MTLKSSFKRAASRLAWSRRKGSTQTLYCSFCGKSQHHVEKLIAGPSVFICNECVALCNDIIDAEDGKARPDDMSPGTGEATGTELKQLPAPEPPLSELPEERGPESSVVLEQEAQALSSPCVRAPRIP